MPETANLHGNDEAYRSLARAAGVTYDEVRAAAANGTLRALVGRADLRWRRARVEALENPPQRRGAA